MGYTVPVVVADGDKKITVGYANIENIDEVVQVQITDENARKLLSNELYLSIRSGDVDIEEISFVVHDPNNKE